MSLEGLACRKQETKRVLLPPGITMSRPSLRKKRERTAMNKRMIKQKTTQRILVISIFCLVVHFITYSYVTVSLAASRSSTLVASLQGPKLPTGPGVPTALNMGMPTGIPITNLQAPQTAAHVKNFTLTAQPAHLTLGPGISTDAWTFNGTSPGPTLHVQQGDLVVVKLVNHLSFGVTIHWHGVSVPNLSDGVAGVTQDAVKSGQSYTYRFIAKDPGTYWYHSHQESFSQVTQGLYGMLIVDPATSTEHDDIDTAVALHDWNGTLAINRTARTLRIPAKPGNWVRLRIANTSEQQLVTLLGAPFTVVALDVHDLSGPTPLTTTLLPIGEGQRYDL